MSSDDDIAAFIDEHQITMQCEIMTTDSGPRDRCWFVTVHCDNRQMSLTRPLYASGPDGASIEPQLETVLILVGVGAAMADGRSFSEWLALPQYEELTPPISPEDDQVEYEQCVRNADELKQLLGADAYQELLSLLA